MLSEERNQLTAINHILERNAGRWDNNEIPRKVNKRNMTEFILPLNGPNFFLICEINDKSKGKQS